MDSNIRMAKELVKLAKLLSGATVVPAHALFDANDIETIQDEAEAHDCDVQFKREGDGMTATFDNGMAIAVRLSGDDVEYVVYGDGDEDAEETEQTFQTIEEAIQAIFE